MTQPTYRITLADMERTFTGQEVLELMENLIESALDVVWDFADEYSDGNKHRESNTKLNVEEVKDFADGARFFEGSKSLSAILKGRMWEEFSYALNDPAKRD